MKSISEPIVLVGHCYGGAVITNAATGDKQVKALVYIDAFAPGKGQTIAQLLAAFPGSCAAPANLNFVPFPGAPKGVADAYIKQSAFPSCMANGLRVSEARVLAATQRPLASIALGEKSGVPAWKTIPSWSVVGTADHAIRRALQLAMDIAVRPHHQGARASPVHDLRPGDRDQSHPQGCPGNHLTGGRPPGPRPAGPGRGRAPGHRRRAAQFVISSAVNSLEDRPALPMHHIEARALGSS